MHQFPTVSFFLHLDYYKQRGMYAGGCNLDFRFSLLYVTPANISRKPATGGMASQHLHSIERGYLRKRSYMKESQKTLTN